MFFCAALVILMIIKFRFPKGKSIHQVIDLFIVTIFLKMSECPLESSTVKYFSKWLSFTVLKTLQPQQKTILAN